MRKQSVVILPSILTLPLPTESHELFSRAVRLVQQRADEFAPVGEWLDKYYSEQAMYQRMLPEKKQSWDHEQRDLTAAPTKAEMDGRATGQSWYCQRAQSWKEHRRQHREAQEMNHPKYKTAMADRRARLRDLKQQRKKWRPSPKTRLTRVVGEMLEVEYPDPPEHVEHSRRIVGIAALLVCADPLPVLGEFGRWEWESKPDKTWEADPTNQNDDLLRELSQPPAQDGPHTTPLHLLHARHEGREEVLFHRMPGERRELQNQWADLPRFRQLLSIAVDELEEQAIALSQAEPPPININNNFFGGVDMSRQQNVKIRNSNLTGATTNLGDNSNQTADINVQPPGSWIEACFDWIKRFLCFICFRSTK